MKNLFESFVIILSVYTRIPMPMISWNKDNLRYAFCFLPAAGLAAGALQASLSVILYITGISPVLSAAAACAVPFFVTGGIHMDGFSDTMDALSSHAEKQKKLAIMDDPHIGAFGVMWMIIYMMVSAASYYEIFLHISEKSDMTAMTVYLLLIPVISRSLTVFVISRIELSKKKGMLYTFTDASDKKLAAAASLITAAAALAAITHISTLFASICACVTILLFLYFRKMSVREFGGISGDLCGWLIQMSELFMLAAAAVLADFGLLFV